MQNHHVLTLARIALLTGFLTTTTVAQEDSATKPNPESASPEASKDTPSPQGKRARKKKEQKKNKKSGKTPKEESAPRRPLTPADYAKWELLDTGQRMFSNDGAWLSYGIRRIDEERTLFLHRVKDGKTTEEAKIPHGERPVFSKDSQWLVVTIGKSPAEKKKAQKAKTPPSPGALVKLRRLKDGEVTEFKNVGGVLFSNDSRFAAIEVMGKKSAPRPSGPARPGSTPSSGSAGPSKALLVRNLEKGTDTTFGNVMRFAWSDQGSLLALVIDSPSISNSLQLFDPASGVLRTLDSSEEEFTSLSWRKDSYDLAATREMKHGEKEDVSHVLLAWRGLDQGNAKHFQFNHAESTKFSNKHFISTGLQWSRDGAALFCGLREWEKKPKDFPTPAAKKSGKKGKKKGKNKKKAEESTSKENAPAKQGEPAAKKKGKEEEKAENKEEKKQADSPTLRKTLETPSNVEIWHSKDVDIMPRQKKEASAKKNPRRRAAWWPEKGVVIQLESELTERVTILGTGRRAIGIDATPHERAAMFGPRLQDVYAVNALNGKRERILEGVKFTLSASPDGRYLLYVRDGQVWSHDLKKGRQRNLTGSLGTHFTNQEDDTLAVKKRPYGSGTWFKDSSAVLLYDRYDIWLLAPNGSRAVRLTQGREDEIRHRLSQVNMREENDGHLDPNQTLYLALYGDRTKKSGYARLALGASKSEPGKVERLLWDDKMILYLNRAKDADVYSFTMERNDVSRDLYVAGRDVANPHRVTRTNAFQKDYQWGRSELIDYENAHGVKLQGSLIYPANYKPGSKYPMIVYIYEKRSQELHRYITPSEKHPYNPCVYSAEGYFVFQPDIVYRPQEPGISAVECVVPAVKKVLETGMVDPKRVGLMGHSWGAYQTAFIVTQSDLFAAGVAGAPLTDLLSMSVSVYWNSGGTNARIFAQSQGRMDKPFWRDVDTYVRNSPIHGLDNLNTPLLIAFGDKDGAVDWDQGVEMYNAARWAGKEDVVMLVYPGENHGLRKEENMVDYHYRVKAWMAHHVKGEDGEKWITEGKSFLEREKEMEELKEKKSAPRKPAPAAKTEEKKAEKDSSKVKPEASQPESAPAKRKKRTRRRKSAQDPK